MTEQEIQLLRKWVHDLNNRVGTILATAELMQTEQLSSKSSDRSRIIEAQDFELREIIQQSSVLKVQ
jgi:hypothetical protein